MKLSNRLNAVIECVKYSEVVADIGTDHGYVPIELIKRGKCKKAIAMDINKGPLARADENIRRSGLEKVIETRLSNGMNKLNEGEADTVVIAGMGGELITWILEENAEVAKKINKLILSPQSEIKEFRQYMIDNSYIFIDEHFLEEDGKYYVIVEAVHESCIGNEENKAELINSNRLYRDIPGISYGGWLIEKRDKTLKKFLKKERKKMQEICEVLRRQESEKALKRFSDISEELRIIDLTLKKMMD